MSVSELTALSRCILIFRLSSVLTSSCFFFFFNDTPTTEIYTLSLHDALPISRDDSPVRHRAAWCQRARRRARAACSLRSEEHTSELQSQFHLVCRLLLEKKKKNESDVDRPLQRYYCIWFSTS